MSNMEVSREKMISYVALLLILCVLAFLVAKYMVRRNISQNDIPIDTSTRLD